MRSSGPFRFLSEPRAALAAALARWARARQGDDTPPLTLQARRIYILPTRAGIAAAALLFLMLLAGMNYNNSLALLLCFILCGVTLVSMHECHAMLSGLKLLRAAAGNSYAGRLGELQLCFENAQTRSRSGLQLCSPGSPASRFELAPGSTQSVRVIYAAGARGRQRIERLELSSNAPLGLFRAWTWLHLPLDAIVYPAPGGTRPLPARRGDPRDGERRSRVSGEEEWAWLRAAAGERLAAQRRLESLRARRTAAGRAVRCARGPAPPARLRAAESLPLEQRLSQLAQWVLDCERLGDTYRLQLPQQALPVGHGIAQQRACLEALALYGL